MDGVLVVDKPQGLTSHDVVAVARRCLKESRIGHTGTLDPLATGVLPLACGRATRLVRFLSSSDKDYEAVIRFGMTTESYDITGSETTRSGTTPSREAVEEAVHRMRGEHLQVPPPFSAKKVAGQRAYARARRAERVELEPVAVRLTRADVLHFTRDTVTVALTCSAGFYVRAFAHMLGEQAGTGACLESLRRTRSGQFDIAAAVPLEDLQRDPDATAARAVPLDRLLLELPGARLTDEGRSRVSHGQDVSGAHVWPEDTSCLDAGAAAQWVRLLDAGGRLLALGTPARSPFDTRTTSPRALHPAVVLF
jgi:tRNA pseudouridine55 synthase